MSCSNIPQASWQEASWVKQTTGFLCEASPATRPDSNRPVRKTSAPLRLVPGSYLHLRDTRDRLGTLPLASFLLHRHLSPPWQGSWVCVLRPCREQVGGQKVGQEGGGEGEQRSPVFREAAVLMSQSS